MKKKTKIIYSVLLSILVLLLILSYWIPVQTTYYGWIEITDKKVVEDNYYIDANLDDLVIEIVIDEKDNLVYEETPQEIAEVSIVEIWDLIKLDNKYFVRINTNTFRSTYSLEKIYGY